MFTPDPASRYPRVYYNLMVASLLGSIFRFHDDADVCSMAVESTLGDSSRYRMYRAIAKGIGGDAGMAAHMLRSQALDEWHDDRAKIKLAMALLLGGDPEWKPVVDRVLALSTDIPAREAAITLVRYVSTVGADKRRLANGAAR